MLLMGPKKTTMIIGKMDDSKDEKPDNTLMYKVMAADILKAIEAKDASSLANTLQSFYEMCDSEPEDEVEE